MTTIADLSRELRIPPDALIARSLDIGIRKFSPQDSLTEVEVAALEKWHTGYLIELKQKIIEKHGEFLRRNGFDPDGVSAHDISSIYKRTHRTPFCYACKSQLDNEIDIQCRRCKWIICTKCGACGCCHPEYGREISKREAQPYRAVSASHRGIAASSGSVGIGSNDAGRAAEAVGTIGNTQNVSYPYLPNGRVDYVKLSPAQLARYEAHRAKFGDAPTRGTAHLTPIATAKNSETVAQGQVDDARQGIPVGAHDGDLIDDLDDDGAEEGKSLLGGPDDVDIEDNIRSIDEDVPSELEECDAVDALDTQTVIKATCMEANIESKSDSDGHRSSLPLSAHVLIPICLFVEPNRFKLFCPFCGKEIFREKYCSHVTFSYRFQLWDPEFSRFTYSVDGFAKVYIEQSGLNNVDQTQFLNTVDNGGVAFSYAVIERLLELNILGEHSVIFDIRTCNDQGEYTDIYSEEYSLVIGLCNEYESFRIIRDRSTDILNTRESSIEAQLRRRTPEQLELDKELTNKIVCYEMTLDEAIDKGLSNARAEEMVHVDQARQEHEKIMLEVVANSVREEEERGEIGYSTPPQGYFPP